MIFFHVYRKKIMAEGKIHMPASIEFMLIAYTFNVKKRWFWRLRRGVEFTVFAAF